MAGKLGERIKRARLAKGLGLRFTANQVEISAAYLSRLERVQETHPPSEAVIRKLAVVLDDDFDTLMRLGGRIPSDIAKYIVADSKMLAFIREAQKQKLSAGKLLKMLEQYKKEGL